MKSFSLTTEEANLLERIAEATKMDCWFRIDGDLHVIDAEGEMPDASEAELVCMLEDGLGYGLDEPQSGGLNPEEIGIVEACFKRAHAAISPKRYYKVPVVYEMYGSVTVEAASAGEAYDKVKDHTEDFKLPDEGFYVDDSFKVADDDRENAVATIEEVGCPDDEGPTDDGAASGRRTGLTVKATVTFQRWEGDIARFNGEAEFDACDALDSMDDADLAEVERNNPYALDRVYMRAVSLGQIHGYDGPFEVELDEDNFSDYLEERRNG